MSTPRRGENPPSRCNPATAMFLSDIGELAGLERGPCAPYCGHIPPSLLSGQWEVPLRGELRRRHTIRDVRRHPSIRAEELGHGSLTDREGDGVCRVFKSTPAVPVAFGTCGVGVNRP